MYKDGEILMKMNGGDNMSDMMKQVQRMKNKSIWRKCKEPLNREKWRQLRNVKSIKRLPTLNKLL